MNLPNRLSTLRMCLIPVFVVLFFLPYDYMRFAAVGVFMLASLTDALDGYIARKYNLITNLGKFLDSIADKMLVTCALLAIMTDDHAFILGVVICTMIIICRDLIINMLRIMATLKNVVLAADKLGKIKAILQMVSLIFLIPYANIAAIDAGIASIFLYIGLVLLALSTIMALVSGLNYVIKNRQVFAE